ncbi:MAG: T9SS type A sorting domain-containing protein, partial [Fimbriimonadaceae bacterium]|nr:T9SS type A sorting domain-containing protein [Chitinophagales bacterium]
VTDTLYNNNLRCRWEELRESTLSEENIFHYIDSIEVLVDIAKDRHYQIWPILGVYVWPNPYPLADTYAEEIVNLKTWIAGRLTWLDESIPGICYAIPEDTVIVENVFGGEEINFIVTPNPATTSLFIKVNNFTQPYSGSLISVDGKEIITTEFNHTALLQMNLENIAAGIYVCRIYAADGKVLGNELIQKL